MFKRAKFSLGLFALAFVALIFSGCGSDNKDVFVATGNSPNAQVGNLSFAFTGVNPQTAGEVPGETTLLRFDFFRSNPPSVESLVGTEIRPYAESIVIESVPSDVILVVVTALNGDGFPLITLQGDAEVVLGETTPVDLGNAVPITLDTLTVSPDPTNVAANGDAVQLIFTLGFSNGSNFQLPNFNTPEATITQPQGVVANITSTGLVSTDTGGQNTNALATYTFGGQSVQDEFQINTFDFEVVEARQEIGFPTDLAKMIKVENINLQELEQDGVQTVFVANFLDSNGVSTNVVESCTFALAQEATGVTLDPNTGVLTADETAQNGTVTVIVTYEDDDSGLTFTDSFNILLFNVLSET